MLGRGFNGFYHRFTQVDKLTKYAHFCALSNPFKDIKVSTFMETIQKLHGNPKIIVSGRDPNFTRNFWTELFSCFGTQLAHSSSYHPQSDGKIEKVNKCLEGLSLFLCI